MSHRSFFVSVITTVLLCSYSVQSQEPAAGGATDAKAVARKKAIELLVSVAGQVNGMRSAENRARIGSNVADLLWDHDEKRARGLFAAVEDDIKAALNSVNEEEAVRNNSLMVFLQLRSEILDRIARHDPELAMEFLHATPPPSAASTHFAIRASERSRELRLARQLAAKSPQLALQLGRESLAGGLSIDLLGVLSQLQRKDKETARSFFKDIVDKLKSANLGERWEAGELVLNLAQSFQPPEVDEQVYRDLIGIVLAVGVAYDCEEAEMEYPSPICRGIGSLFSRIEKYYAPRAAALKRWDGQSRLEDFPPLSYGRISEVAEEGTADEIRTLASKYPAQEGQIYWVAVTKAAASGDVAKARQLASDVTDEQIRRTIVAQLDRTQMWTSLDEEKLAAIQEQLSRLHSNEERIELLLRVAGRIVGTDRKAAMSLLNQAGQIIDYTKPGKAQIRGQVTLAVLYCSLKSDRGFAIIEPLLPKLNELVAAAATLDGVENNYLRDGEWNMTGEGVVGGLLTHLAQNVGYFASLDFERSVTLASQLERPELRLMAQSKIAQAILTGQGGTIRPIAPGTR